MATSLKKDAELSAFCIGLLGKDLSYYRDTLLILDEELPYLVALKFSKKFETGMGTEWIIQIQIGVLAIKIAEADADGVKYFQTNDNVNAVSSKVLERLQCLLRDFGIKDPDTGKNDTSITINQHNTVIAEAGESLNDDRAIMTITFAQDSMLNMES